MINLCGNLLSFGASRTSFYPSLILRLSFAYPSLILRLSFAQPSSHTRLCQLADFPSLNLRSRFAGGNYEF